MKNLYIIVEGQTEEEFVNTLLSDYLYQQGLTGNIQAFIIKKKGKAGGFINIEHFKSMIEPLLHYRDEPIITTLIDYYGINSKKKMPNYEICSQEQDVKKRISCMEDNLSDIIKELAPNYRFFIPNIIQHEMETLLFANPEMFDYENVKGITKDVEDVCAIFPEIEDINNTPEGAPSKRLAHIYEQNNKKYQKTTNGINIATLIGIETMLAKAPRFKAWVEKIIQITKNTL